jgi:rSAM/selenodomain-associated transferase 1
VARSTICIFARPPLPGQTKTRLIPAVGAEGAAKIARALLEDLVEVALQVEDSAVIVSATQPFQFDGMGSVPLWLQPDGDLGLRIERTLRQALLHSPLAVALGADTPGLSAHRVEKALIELLESDAVLGPAEDGGYYLVGVRRCPDHLFNNIRWSHPETLRDTVAQFQRFGMTHNFVPKWSDLDTPDDLIRICSLLQAGTICAPRLHSVLKSIGVLRDHTLV